MRKILFLLLICIIKLNAYELQLLKDDKTVGEYSEILLLDTDGRICTKRKFVNGRPDQYYYGSQYFYWPFSNIKTNRPEWITLDEYRNYEKNNLDLINAEFTQITNAYLNFLYNPSFSSQNYINYTDYEILYNREGLAVESIVNGNWAGLYDGPDNSGYLYNEKGDLLYKNGVPVSFLEKLNDKLLKKFKNNLESIFIKKIFYPLLVLIFACVIFRSVIRMAFKAFLICFYDKKISQLEKRREKIENA